MSPDGPGARGDDPVVSPGAGPDDRAAVAELLGREPQGAFEVAVRGPDGRPMVIRNAPLLDDGTPMPTSHWLVDPELNRRIGTLEAAGGVRRAEAELDPAEVASAHDRYAAERDARLPAGHTGLRPTGGVGGTRRGLKCLHAHYAWFLAGGDDPVGRWVRDRLYGPPVAGPGRTASGGPDGDGPANRDPEDRTPT